MIAKYTDENGNPMTVSSSLGVVVKRDGLSDPQAMTGDDYKQHIAGILAKNKNFVQRDPLAEIDDLKAQVKALKANAKVTPGP